MLSTNKLASSLCAILCMSACGVATSNEDDFVCKTIGAISPEGNNNNIYMIGNSLTFDVLPPLLDGQVSWHIDCGKSLSFIEENPDAPCIEDSFLWPSALSTNNFDILSVQPHYGTTIAEDTETISRWIDLQPQANVVIHTGWARLATLFEEFENPGNDSAMRHNQIYFSHLMSQLSDRYPNTNFTQTAATCILIDIANDIENGDTPLTSIDQLYRDIIHMDKTIGRYLMHNTVRHALGQPFSDVGFEGLPMDIKLYLDLKLSAL